MEKEEHSLFQGELKFISNRKLNNDRLKGEQEKKSKELTNQDKPEEEMIAQKQFSQKINNNIRTKCIQLGLEENDSSPNNRQSFKEKDISSHTSDSESENEMLTKLDTSLSENYASLSSSAEDSGEEITHTDCNLIGTDECYADDFSLKEKESRPVNNSDNVASSLMKHLETDSLMEHENTINDKILTQSLSFKNLNKNESVNRKRKFLEDIGFNIESKQEDLAIVINFPSDKYLKMDCEDMVSKNRPAGLSNQCSISEVGLTLKKELETLKTCINTSFNNENSAQSISPNKPHSSKSHTSSKTKNSNAIASNILDQIATAFAKQLKNFNFENLTPSQASQLKEVLENKKTDCIPASNGDQRECTSNSSPSGEISNRLSVDTDDMLPIQAEVVMSDDSDCEHSTTTTQEHNVDKEVENYVNSFMNCPSQGSILEYPPLNNEVPKDGSDLTTWQLENVSLPPFKPFVQPPTWLRFTIPPEGYKCDGCRDTFLVESCLVQHRERRSMWISVECGPCDAKLTFYNKCAYKSHMYHHEAKGELVDDITVEVLPLPLQLTKLLQPIIVPVPQTVKPTKNRTRGSPCKTPQKVVPTSQGTPGKENLPKITSPISSALSLTSLDDRNSAFNDGTDVSISTAAMTSRRNVKCYLCERSFASVRELMSHMRTNQSSSDQRVECRKCLLVLPSVCAAKAHILTHPIANSGNISVCPECGSRCEGPRDFVHHLNTCGHQYRRSGVRCEECHVSFFKFSEDFINHWVKEHCSRSYECVVCSNSFESLVFHKCSTPGQQLFATFKCLLTCPICPYVIQIHTQEEKETFDKIRAHLTESHPSAINRVHYVYKSKFCTNAFGSKDELRAHHDREHRRDNHYRTKTCSLHHEVLGYQQQYFNGQEPRNAFISIKVPLSPEEIQEAQTMDVPTVSSVIDKTLFPGGPMTLVSLKALKEREKIKEVEKPLQREFVEPLIKVDRESIESLRPFVCYRCGYTYTGSKDIRRHKRDCEGESASRLCQVCGVTAVGEEFSRHCITHISEGLLLCMYCNGASFPTPEMLRQHFELHVHEQFSYPAQCAFCSFTMPDVAKALSHLHEEHDPLSSPVAHETSSSFDCDWCGRIFQGERGLNVHLTRCAAVGTKKTTTATVTSSGKQCHVCKKSLTNEMYGKHIIGHLEEGLLVCSLCDGLSLSSSMALLQHLKEHSSKLEFPYLCPVCSFTMSNSDEAFTHLKEDHGLGNISCSGCEMKYTFTYQLQRHIDIVHKVCLYAKRRYICWICRAYDHVKKETLMNHFRMVHGLSREEVDEKVMIRTRGQGTMPTSHFIPTKPLGSKELGSSKSDSKADGDNRSKGSKLTSSPLKRKSQSNNVNKKKTTVKSPKCYNDSNDLEFDIENVVIKQELLDVIQNTSDNESAISFPSSKMNGFDLETVKSESGDGTIKTEGNSSGKGRSGSSSSPHQDRPGSKLVKEKVDLSSAKDQISESLDGNGTDKIAETKLPNKNRLNKTPPVKVMCKPSPVVAQSTVSSVKDQPIPTSVKSQPQKLAPPRISIKIGRKYSTRTKDTKLRKRTKVMIKRLPDSALPSKSRNKKNNLKTFNKDKKKKMKAFKCNLCNYSTNSKFKLEFHESKHEIKSDEGFLCNVCGQSFVVEPSLKRHLFFAHKIKQRAQQQTSQPLREYTVVKANSSKRLAKRITRKPSVTKNSNIATQNVDTTTQKAGTSTPKLTKSVPRKITIKIKNSPPKIEKKEDVSEDEKVSDMQCCVCKEIFSTSVKLYSHLRTHGMAFLKLGRKKRNFVQEKSSITC